MSWAMDAAVGQHDEHSSAPGPSSGSSASGSAPDEHILISIGDPQKHGEGAAAFVSYLVRSRRIAAPERSVRRRFQDFVALHRLLVEAHPSSVVPPLPGKHRMEYITGDRFSAEFIEKRRLALVAFLDRIARHPILRTSQTFHRFLEAEQMSASDSPKRESHVFENLGDVLLNAFSKVKKPDEKFLEIRESIDKFEHNLSAIEKLHTKMLKVQSELAASSSELGGSITSLGMMETQISQPLNEFGNRLSNYSDIIREKIRIEDQEYVLSLHEYIAYCSSVKDVLKTRDQKQIDNEELIQWLASYKADREKTMSTGKSPGITGFFKDKINDLKGVDPEKARMIRLVKLDAKIHELEEAVEQSKITSEAFSREVAKEIEFFQACKLQDFKQYLQSNIDAQIAFHEKSYEFWESLLPVVEKITLDAPPQSPDPTET